MTETAYSTGEKLRKRLDDLETLAASVAKTREAKTQDVAEESSSSSPSNGLTSSPDQTPPDWSPESCIDEFPLQIGQDTLSIDPKDVSVPAAVENASNNSSTLWDSATSIDPCYLTMTNYGKSSTQHELRPTVYVDCGCSVRHVEVRTMAAGGYEIGVELLRVGETKVFSDPYLNHIRIDAMCTMTAMWENCLQLGIPEWVLCDETSQSSFYRPGSHKSNSGSSSSTNLITSGSGYNTDVQAVDGVVRTVQSIWKSVKPDLRPIKEQVTIAHHPCLDIFPFPTFRKNALRGTMLLDEDEFFLDATSGLMCWGGAGGGKADHKGGAGKASTGSPWDHRSWEGKPWFLRKYWILLGGEEGELVRQSEWWRSTRGEEGDIWTSEAFSEEPDPARDLMDAVNTCRNRGFMPVEVFAS